MRERIWGMMVVLFVSVALAPCFSLAGKVPLALPRPDDAPANMQKPVKVYILAGQSNMVGFGNISGAVPQFSEIFYTPDPAVIPGNMPVGNAAVRPLRVFRGADVDAELGALITHHRGAYDPDVDYSTQVVRPNNTHLVALGTVDETLPGMRRRHTPIVRAYVEAPATGTFTAQAGFGDSAYNIVKVAGREVYRREVGGQAVTETVELEKGKRYPVEIIYLRGAPRQEMSAAFWLRQVNIRGVGDLVYLTQERGKYSYLVDDAGAWTVRPDVFLKDARLRANAPIVPLSVRANGGRMIGPEQGFGHVMGTFHDAPVLLIKCSIGNRSLDWDFRPPSSGRTQPDNEYEGVEYRMMVDGVRATLADIAEQIPGYAGQGYEIAGFVWFQGHKDAGSSKEAYEEHLVNLIQDLRKDLEAPGMRAVVATIGFGGFDLYERYRGVWEAQMAVGDPEQHPDFAGNVASVDTRDFWREIEESPRSQDYHYHQNPETYLLVGEASGRAMVQLLGGAAAPIPVSDREARTAARLEAAAAAVPPTDTERAASVAALKPIVLETLLPEFVNSPRNVDAVRARLRGDRLDGSPAYLDDLIDEAVGMFRVVGIRDYDWQQFGPDSREIDWAYYAFDTGDPDVQQKGIDDLALTIPARGQNWFAPDFDVANAGWQLGRAPFGVLEDPLAHDYPDWYLERGNRRRPDPTTAFEGDVLLLRNDFDLPELVDGYRYRVRVAGSARHDCGEGFAVYVNGDLLADVRQGVVAWRREGGRPRGAHIPRELHDVLNRGEVTIAVSNFPKNNRRNSFVPPRAPLSIWVERQKLPPLPVPVGE